MTHQQQILLESLAVCMAPGRRVLLVEPSFEVLSQMAVSAVTELVVISADADPDAPPGETPSGAPLRIRPNWNERPRSKDLIVDLNGKAPADEVDRLLKKHGAYVTAKPNKATRALPLQKKVQAETVGLLLLGECESSLTVELNDTERSEGPSIIIGSRHPVQLPAVSRVVPGKAHGAIGKLEKELKSVTAKVARRDAALASQRDELKTHKTEHATAEKALVGLQKQLQAAESSIASSDNANGVLQGEFAALENDYDGVRAELAEARIAVKRQQGLEDRFRQVRIDMNKEIESLEARLRDLDAPGADLQQLDGERLILMESYGTSLNAMGRILHLLIPGQALPATPGPGISEAQGRLISAWLDSAKRRAVQTQARNESRSAEFKSSKGKLARLQKRIRVLEQRVAVPAERVTDMPLGITPVFAESDEHLQAQLGALKQALEAEQTRRALAEQRVGDVSHSAAYALSDRNRLIAELNERSLKLHEAELSRILAEEAAAQARTELQERIHRLDEFEAMLTTHDQLQVLMSDAIREAQEARDEAQYARQLADENLRLMRAEFERVSHENVTPSETRP